MNTVSEMAPMLQRDNDADAALYKKATQEWEDEEHICSRSPEGNGKKC